MLDTKTIRYLTVQEQMVLCENLLREKFNEHDIEDIKSTIDVCSEYVSEKLQEHQTQLKRLKKLRMNPLYVEPETKSIGLKWKTQIGTGQRIPNHTLVQTTFEYVPIMKTLKVLFSNAKFRDQYFNYNQQMKHKCVPNVCQQ